MSARLPGADRPHEGTVTVVFDLDGVLTHHDTFGALVRAQLMRARWRLLLSLPVVAAFALSARLPRVRARLSRSLVRIALLGRTEEWFTGYAERFGAELARTPGWVVHDAVRRIRDHQERGDLVAVATATDRGLAAALLRAIGVRDVVLVASGVRTGRLGLGLAPHNHGRRKPGALVRAGAAPPWDVVYTDSLADLPLLRGARRAVLVNATRATRSRAARRLGRPVETAEWS
ncbi:haloacid dehalogenase-like hydrolase [Nocardiopsis ansamitocini]|uniref:Phosphatidylglycerophosphatase C n=1 Tax=Nocardiopsis ansamitocini TaxID=1670832 RepID=A0A9W6PAY1_9ACTN|nr:haloacid dehalogenase-like hydrolase [Nocardiopsis ansamitocini]GLU50340.1 hypothetical protein Nans01_46910 [Nocardiopsis ansamitocini]